MPLPAACDAVLYTARTVVNTGLQERGEARGWTRQQYAAVLAALAKSPHGALRCCELEADAAAGGALALEAMQNRNLLIRRSWHATLRDLPAEAFGDPPEDVFTLPSAAHLVVARQRFESSAVDATGRLHQATSDVS